MELANEDREITLKDFFLKLIGWFKFIKSKAKTIFIIGALGALIGFCYALIKKPVYKAELNFVIQDTNGSSSGAFALASQFGINLEGSSIGSEFSGDNLLEFMKSRFMVEKTFLTPITLNTKQTTLAENYIDFSGLRKDWSDNEKIKNIHFLPREDRKSFTLKKDSVLWVLYKQIIKTITVDKIDKKLSLINLTVISENQFFAKAFAENLVKNVSDFYVYTKTKKASQSVSILQKQTDSVKRVLNSSILGAASSSDINPNPNLSRQVLKVPSQRKQVDIQASTALLTELIKNLELSKMSLLQETPLVQIIDTPIFPLEKIKFGRLKGILLGGFISSFLTIIFFTLRRMLYKIMSAD